MFAGGLVSSCLNSKITNSYATGDATASSIYAGGLIAQAITSEIEHCYATGNVQAFLYAGGFIGQAVTETAASDRDDYYQLLFQG